MRRVNIADLDPGGYARVAARLRAGGVVAMPTDTVYGLAVDASHEAAVTRLFRLKGRPADRPLILLVDSVAMALGLTSPGPDFHELAGRFWPGPISFVLPAKKDVLPQLTAGTRTIALRWPDFSPAVKIVQALGGPITSTSANRSGESVLRSADAVASVLPDVDLILDAGAIPPRPPSTLVDLTGSAPALLREGAIAFDEIRAFLAARETGRPA